MDTSNPAGGLGGAVSPAAGFGAAPRKFCKFMVSITSGHLFLASLDGSFWHSVKGFNPKKKMKKSYTVFATWYKYFLSQKNQ